MQKNNDINNENPPNIPNAVGEHPVTAVAFRITYIDVRNSEMYVIYEKMVSGGNCKNDNIKKFVDYEPRREKLTPTIKKSVISVLQNQLWWFIGNIDPPTGVLLCLRWKLMSHNMSLKNLIIHTHN